MNEQSTYLPRPVTEPDVAPTSTTIHALLATWAALTPEAIAIGAPSRPGLTYRRLDEQVGQVAAALAARGLGRGDRLAIVLPNGPEMAVAFLSAAALSTCAPLNPAYRAEEFAFYLADLGATALLVQAGDCSPVIAVAREQGIPVIELTPLADAAAGLFALTGQSMGAGRPLDLAQPDDTALVLHTSGTTARPKIVPLTQRNLCCSAAHTRSALALTSADRCLNIMPLFHIHGLIGAVLASLAAGGSVICTPGFDVPLFFDWLDLCRPTWYTAVPTMHQAILARSDAGREIILRRPLRFIRSASSALAPRVGQDLERAFGAPVVQAYGMTEAAHQVAGNPLPPRVRKPGSVGLAAGPEVAVMDDGGRLLGAGETGEVVIRGPNVMRGYGNNDEATSTAFAHGWFRTGDQGLPGQ